jgi:site-specific DNA recombinase
MKAAIYCRVSTDEQVQHGTSLDTQRERTKAYIEEHGWAFVDAFVDEGVSGARESRPQLDLLMAACRKGEIEKVVVTKLDRFSRSLLHALTAFAELEALGVSVECTDEPSEPGLIRNVQLSVAEHERQRIAERTMAGRRARVKAGFYVGGPTPFGHHVVDQRLQVNEEEAETIRRAAHLLRKGTSLAETVHILNDEGRLPRQTNPRWGKSPRKKEWHWNRDSLRLVLSCESLTGKYVWGRKSREGPIEQKIPPILDKATFDAVQKRLKATRMGPNGKWHVYPLANRLVSPCGKTYTGNFDPYGEGTRLYRCSGRYLDPTNRCSCRRLRADVIEEQVWWAIVPLLEDEQRLLELTGLDSEDDQKQASEALKVLDAKAENLEEAITKRAADALAAGLSPEVIASAVERLQAELDAVNRKRESATSWQETAKERKERRSRLSVLARASLKLLNAKHDLAFQKTLLNLLDVMVEQTNEGIKVRGVLREDLPFHLSTLSPFDSEGHSVTAQKILDYRQKHGAFTSVDGLDAVPGIGPARLDQLKDLVAP